jgi:hypothetical protein
VLIGVYWLSSLPSNLNIGLRHMLPTYAAAMILAGAVGRWTAARAGRVAIPALLALTALESRAVHPHYLAFFNALAGGPSHGYRHLVDSNLDWGQDLPGLAHWLAERPDADRCYLSYFGSALPEQHAVHCIRLPGFFDFGRPLRREELDAGTYCISATMLQALHLDADARGRWTAEHELRFGRAREAAAQETDAGVTEPTPGWSLYERLRFARLMAYLREREPDDQVGYSILIYRLDAEELGAAQRGPLRELGGREGS